MPHLHLQIQFGSDFEGYAAGSSPPFLAPPSFIPACSNTWNIMQIFVKSEYNYVGGELSVGMLAMPLTLSAAALSWIPWLNFNRCSTMWIRQGDLAVLFLCVVHYACLMPMFVSMVSMCISPAKSHVHARKSNILFCICVFLPSVCVCVRRECGRTCYVVQ